MNETQQEKPTELAIDVEQWQRDIQTFVQTTTRALSAIAAELSVGCSSSNVGLVSPIGAPNAEEALNNPAKSFTFTESQGQEKLAQLKSQLAERISKQSELTTSDVSSRKN